MDGGKLKSGWREVIERLKEKDRLLGLAETHRTLPGVFDSGDTSRERTECLFKEIELGFDRINNAPKGRRAPTRLNVSTAPAF